MKQLTIPGGTPILLGAPAKPIEKSLSDAIGEMISKITEIQEAYLPQCYAKGFVEPPAQILVIVLDSAADTQSILTAVGNGLSQILPQGVHLDVWPMDQGHGMLANIRNTKTNLHSLPPPLPTQQKKPWWRF